MVTCGNCGTENPSGHAFCSQCGHALSRACPSCGTANDPTNRFCFTCGTGLVSDAQTPATSSAPAPRPVDDAGERRLVSVVFADLVGFTTFSEHRDPEDVRAMLTHYYEQCREIIGRYGGTTDKFIGDAVMGVWGAVAAHEDDAERATRAALELVGMVAGLGSELGIAELAARAGVLSGEASVGSGGNAHGLVVGDLVNTASRLQSIAPPGSVFVGQSTKDLVGSTIEFTPVGEQHVKGKEIPVAVFHAVRVLALSTARRGGELTDGPFVGRDDELRILKDQLHAAGREGKARMVSVIGEGGIGKTRLSQELVRYIDGITEDIYYHSGRSPSYGDGVTFWALGEMIRHRAGIVEGEDAAKSRLKLRTTVAEFAPTEEDQRWIEPRLAAVIGLAPMPPGDRSELFAALRAFFQAVAGSGTVLMVFEDLHWADDGLLDFVEELVERTTNHPILVLCLTRPELLDRRPDWAAARKRSLTMHLSRLDEASMRLLVAGLAPGIPASLADRIAERTAGIPLHAVEFVRMLLNTGQLVREGSEFRFIGSDDQLSIPDTVSAIIGARLDRLDAVDLAAIQDAAVLGLSFTLADLAAVRGVVPEDIERRLRDLVRREILELEEDPRSPERGQYRFVQSLIREVAYGRLSKSERVSRHLEVAKRFEELDDPELAGVIASHYADAAESDPNNAELRDRARTAVVAAAGRAATLHSDKQAADLYLRAIEMTEDPDDADRLRLQAMESMLSASLYDESVAMGWAVLDRARAEGNTRLEILTATALAKILASGFESDKAVEVILPVYEVTPQTPDVTWARLAGETSRALMLVNRAAESVVIADAAIPVMEQLDLTEELLEALVNKGSSLANSGRWIEGSAILRGAADLAGRLDMTIVKLRALNNLLSSTLNDNQVDRETSEEIANLIQRLGNQSWSERFSYVLADEYTFAGRFDEAMVEIHKVLDTATWEFIRDSVEHIETRIRLLRDGVDDEGLASLMAFNEKYQTTDDPQLLQHIAFGTQWDLILAEDYAGVVAIATEMQGADIVYPTITEAGILAAAVVGDQDALERFTDHIVAEYPRGRACRGLIGIATAFGAALRGDTDEAIAGFAEADDVWVDVMDPTRVAFARATMAILLGPDQPMGVAWGEQARHFFAEHGMKAYLDGIIQRVPAAPSATELTG